MAGIIIALGHKAKDNYLKCYDEFVKIKELKLSYLEEDPTCYISKFCRPHEKDDNYLISDVHSLFVVGTLIYKKQLGKIALQTLSSDLEVFQIDSLIDYCDGPFCLIIKYSLSGGIRIITDHAGLLNIYQYSKNDSLVISTSSLSLSRAYPVTPHHESIVQFLRIATICGNKTIYNEIELLDPATIYHYKLQTLDRNKSLSKKRYWQSPIQVQDDLSFDDSVNLLSNHLLEGLDIFTNKSFICDFTAGFDSRLIMTILTNKYKKDDINTFVFGPNKSREVKLVKLYCENLGYKNCHLTLPDRWEKDWPDYVKKALNTTDGEENAFSYSLILWAQEFKARRFQYSINGLGGELYRDFWWLQELFPSKRAANLDKLISLRVLQYDFDISIFSDPWKKRMLQIKDILSNKYMQAIQDMDPNQTFNTLQIDNIYFREKIRRWAGRTTNSSNQLISVISPLTLRRCLQTTLAIPPRYKVNARLVKAIIEKHNPSLAKQIMLNGAPCENLTFGNTYKFIPQVWDLMKKSIRKVSQEMLGQTILLDTSLSYQQGSFFLSLLKDKRSREFIDYDSLSINKILDKKKFISFIEYAQQPNFRYIQQLGNLLTLEMRMKRDQLSSDFI